MKRLGERLKGLRGKISGKEIARRASISQSFYSEIERGIKAPSTDTLMQLADVLGVSVAYLLGETDDPKRPENTISVYETPDGEIFAEHPFEKKLILPEPSARKTPVVWVSVVSSNVKACCGTGNAYAEEVEWEEIGKHPVPFHMVNGYAWQTGQNGIRVITVEGDSMEPRIHDGDWVLFADTQLSNGDLGILKYEGRLMIRGVLFEGENSVRLRALNKDYEDIQIDLSDESVEFYILGKVLLRLPKAERVTGLW